MKKKCPVCHIYPAKISVYGINPCLKCQERRSVFTLPIQPVEMIGQSIKAERQEFAKSIVQPFNSQGVLSKEYLDANGTKGLKVTPEQVKGAKYVWDQAISRNLDITKSK